jgi:hypothetical protein
MIFAEKDAHIPEPDTKHCNGCGNDLPLDKFTGRDTRCRECRTKRRDAQRVRLAEDPALRATFDALLAACSPDPRVRDNVARPGVPRGPGVREARRELYTALRTLGWSVLAISVYARQSPAAVAFALEAKS